MICVNYQTVTTSNFSPIPQYKDLKTVVIVEPQPAIISNATCLYVLAKPSEIEVNPFSLTSEQGAQIGVSIMLACAIAWTFRFVTNAIKPPTPSNED